MTQTRITASTPLRDSARFTLYFLLLYRLLFLWIVQRSVLDLCLQASRLHVVKSECIMSHATKARHDIGLNEV